MKNSKTHNGKDRSQSGNVLIIILVAVILFAALSFTVSEMMRGVDPQAVNKERSPLYAASLLDYMRILRQGVQDIKINGCSDLEISFANNLVEDYEHSPETRRACKLFGPGGGAVTFTEPPKEWLDETNTEDILYGQWYFPRNVCIRDMGTVDEEEECESDGEDNESLIVFLPFISKSLCYAVNERLGHGFKALEEFGNAWPDGSPKFTGVQSDETRLNQDGHFAGCFEGGGRPPSPPEGYHFFYVLLPR